MSSVGTIQSFILEIAQSIVQITGDMKLFDLTGSTKQERGMLLEIVLYSQLEHCYLYLFLRFVCLFWKLKKWLNWYFCGKMKRFVEKRCIILGSLLIITIIIIKIIITIIIIMRSWFCSHAVSSLRFWILTLGCDSAYDPGVGANFSQSLASIYRQNREEFFSQIFKVVFPVLKICG